MEVSVHRRPSESSQEAAIIQALISPLVWEAIGYDNRKDLVLAEGRLNACMYVARILKPVVIPFMVRVPNGIIERDNAISHIEVHTRNFLENVRILDWPARSRHLSLAEHV